MIIRTVLIKNSLNIYVKNQYSTSPKKKTSSLEYCVNLVKKLDYENFLCTLLLPSSIRDTAFAIRAFNVEMSKIQENVTEAHIGPMRIKFWEDCIDNIYKDKPENHPIIKELYYATKRHKLSKLHFKRLITTRSKQLNSSTFRTLLDMEAYADQITTPVYMLLLEASNAKNVKYDHAASHFGKAQGLTNLIRSVPHNLKDKLLFLPQDELVENDISEESIFRGEFKPEKLCEVIYTVAIMAHRHLEKAVTLQESLPRNLRPIFLPSVSAYIYLRNLESCLFDVFSPDIQRSSPKLPFMLLWYRLMKYLPAGRKKWQP